MTMRFSTSTCVCARVCACACTSLAALQPLARAPCPPAPFCLPSRPSSGFLPPLAEPPRLLVVDHHQFNPEADTQQELVEERFPAQGPLLHGRNYAGPSMLQQPLAPALLLPPPPLHC